jgi:glycosyltransferase involved in cell wall biosynthesis
MHVAISATFWDQPAVGSGQYLHGLLGGLAAVAPELRITLLVPRYGSESATSREPPLGAAPDMVIVGTPFDTSSTNLAKLWFEQIGAPRAARSIGAALLHVPYFAPPIVAGLPVVVSILDLIPLLLPEYRGRALVRAYMRLAAAAAPRARAVIAISEASRADIVRHLGIPTGRVSVTPLAAGAQYAPIDRARARAEVLARYGLAAPFVYYVGGLDARKNVATLVRAFAAMQRAGGPAATLAIAGRALGGDPRLFPDIDAVIAAEGAAAWVRRIQVPPADGPLLYAAATIFAYPSRYEGFGLGPLEAMACGTPVVVADSSSLPEVVGDAALRVAPDDIDGWASALQRLLSDRGLHAELRERGLAQAARFSYAHTAELTAAVYQRAIG